MTGPFGDALSLTSGTSKKAKGLISKIGKVRILNIADRRRSARGTGGYSVPNNDALEIESGPKAKILLITEDQLEKQGGDIPNTEAPETKREAENLPFTGDQQEEHNGNIPNTDDPEIERHPAKSILFADALSLTSDASKAAKEFFSKIEKILKVGRGTKAKLILPITGDQLDEHGGDNIPNTHAPETEKEAERLPFTGDQHVEDDAQRLQTSVYSITKVILPTLKWILIFMIVTVELFQAVAFQEEGEGRIKGSHYRKLAAILSSLCLAQPLMGVVYEANRNGATWKRSRVLLLLLSRQTWSDFWKVLAVVCSDKRGYAVYSEHDSSYYEEVVEV